MSKIDHASELAKLFKERDNKSIIGNIIGRVINSFPDIKISILDGKAVLEKEQLYCLSHVLKDYFREYEVQNGKIQFSSSNCGYTNSVNDGGEHASSHSHEIQSLNIDTKHNEKGIIKFTDTLKVGDEVLLCSTEDNQTFFIIDKIVKLGD